MRFDAVMRRGSEQEQRIALRCDDLGEAPALAGFVLVHAVGDAVVCFVDDGEVPARPLQLLQHMLLLGEVEGEQAAAGGFKWVAPEFVATTLGVQSGQ